MKIFLFIFIFISSIFAELPEIYEKSRYLQGEQVFDNKCSSCHVKSMKISVLMNNFIEHDNKILKLKAPTGNEISYRIKSQIGSRDDIEFQIDEATDFVKDYVINPDKAKTICLDGVIKHFDTMPSLKGKVSSKELEEVTYFLYFLEGFNGVNKYYYKDEF